TNTRTPTNTPTITPTSSVTPTRTITPTNSRTNTRTNTPTITRTITPVPTCGLAWRVVSSPSFGNGNNYLYGIAPLSTTDIWTVGWAGNNGIEQTLALHWDGSSWTRFSSPNV